MDPDLDRRRSLAAAAQDRLTVGVDHALGERFRREPGSGANLYDDGIVVRTHDLLERCGRRATHPAQDYVDDAATVRRRVALAALRRLDDDASAARDLAAAVAEVLEDRADLSGRLADWCAALDRAGRSVVAAAALTWASGVVRLVGTPHAIRWADGAAASSDVPGRLVRLSAAHDARTGTPASGERLLLVSESAGGPGDRLRAGHLALVRSLQSRAAPVRVTLASPSRGDLVPVVVDDALLSLAVDRVVEHVALRADRDDAPARPGRWCAHCHLLDVCAEGRAELAGRGGAPGRGWEPPAPPP